MFVTVHDRTVTLTGITDPLCTYDRFRYQSNETWDLKDGQPMKRAQHPEGLNRYLNSPSHHVYTS